MSNSRPRNSRSGQAGAMLPAWPRALVVIAHPDDESFGLGAVVDQLTVAGAAVHIVCYTHGGADFADLEAARHHRRVVILDVRRDQERNDSHITGAVHIPIHQLPSRLADVPAGEVWVHCEAGYRASIAASFLDAAGRTVVAVDDKYERAARAACPSMAPCHSQPRRERDARRPRQLKSAGHSAATTLIRSWPPSLRRTVMPAPEQPDPA